MVLLEHIIILSSVLFSLGIFGAIFRKNLLMVFLSLEIMLTSAGFLIANIASFKNNLEGQIMFIFILVVLACESAIFLAILLRYYQNHKSLSLEGIK